MNILGLSEIWGSQIIVHHTAHHMRHVPVCNSLTNILPSTPLVTPGRAPMRVAFPVNEEPHHKLDSTIIYRGYWILTLPHISPPQGIN